MSATVKYKGDTIASLSNGQTVTLKCAGKVMEGSVEISIGGDPQPGGGITPSGTIDITENGTYDVTNYASARVNVEAEGETAPDYNGSLTVTDTDGTETEGTAFDGTITILDI